MRSPTTAVTRLLLSLGLVAAVGLTVAPTTAAADTAELPTPQGSCGPGSIPETGMQGRVPADAVAAGKVKDGFRCNIEVVSQFGKSGGFKVERYVDAAGHECAYYDSTTLFPSNVANVDQLPTGTFVLDMTNPAKPVRSATLLSPAFHTPHESVLVNTKRGLIAAVAGNPVFAPGQVDVYDISKDCRTPTLASSTPIGVLGHESGFAPDGKTFYAVSLGGGTVTAIDLTNPALPSIVYVGHYDTHALTISDDGNRAYLASSAGFPRNEVGLPSDVDGVTVLDVSDIQKRVTNPQPKILGTVTWPSVTIPQAALPVTIKGTPYLVEMDEFAYNGNRIAGNGERVGAGRIIDISDETKPRVVSDLRLEVNQKANRPALAGDPDGSSATGGYAGHYCAVPTRVDPTIVACSFLASGLRVFDIRDPLRPVEIAYFVAPVPPGGPANSAFASASFVPERNEIWYSDSSRGFYALRVTNGAWPQSAVPAPPAATPVTAPVAGPPAKSGGILAATGLGLPLGFGLTLLVAGLVARRRLRSVTGMSVGPPRVEL